MYSCQNNFKKALYLLKRLRARYLNTLATFHIFDRFKELAAPNIVGRKKASENVKIFDQYLYFFSPIQEATRCYFFIEVAKFFDRDSDALSIGSLLNFLESNLPSFSRTEFIKYHAYNDTDLLLKAYKDLSSSDIKEIRNKIDQKKELIDRLKKCRDKFLAHDQINKCDISITKREILSLLKIIENTIDILFRRLEFSSNSYLYFKKDPKVHLDKIIGLLKNKSI